MCDRVHKYDAISGQYYRYCGYSSLSVADLTRRFHEISAQWIHKQRAYRCGSRNDMLKRVMHRCQDA